MALDESTVDGVGKSQTNGRSTAKGDDDITTKKKAEKATEDNCSQLKKWIFDKDRWMLQRRGIEEFHPLHAQYMQPNLWTYKRESM
jgi:hypothetical protein